MTKSYTIDWTFCEEELPERSGIYLCLIKSSNGNAAKDCFAYNPRSNQWLYIIPEMEIDNRTPVALEIIAWADPTKDIKEVI